MSRILEKHGARVETIRAYLNDCDICASRGDYDGAGECAIAAMSMADIGYSLASELAEIVGEKSLEAAAVWHGFVEIYDELESAAQGILSDCEMILGDYGD